MRPLSAGEAVTYGMHRCGEATWKPIGERAVAAAGVVALALLLQACGGKDSPTAPSTPTPSQTVSQVFRVYDDLNAYRGQFAQTATVGQTLSLTVDSLQTAGIDVRDVYSEYLTSRDEPSGDRVGAQHAGTTSGSLSVRVSGTTQVIYLMKRAPSINAAAAAATPGYLGPWPHGRYDVTVGILPAGSRLDHPGAVAVDPGDPTPFTNAVGMINDGFKAAGLTYANLVWTGDTDAAIRIGRGQNLGGLGWHNGDYRDCAISDELNDDVGSMIAVGEILENLKGYNDLAGAPTSATLFGTVEGARYNGTIPEQNRGYLWFAGILAP
jgi:hypothetical protein